MPSPTRSLLLLSALLAASCSRSTPPEPKVDKSAAPAAAVSASATPVGPASLSARLSRPAAERLVAIGDLHGDLDATRRALRLAGAIDAKDAWVGGSLVVVQTGDAVDRGDDDRKILDLLERLKADAKKAGGELIAMSGNHELMNVQLDFRYVTPGALAEFADVKPTLATKPRIERLDEGSKGRGAAFAPGGPYATMLVERPIVMKVGDNVFAHGGILPKHVRYGLDKMDEGVRDWLTGKRAESPAIVAQEDGPVWTRMYSAAPGKEECATLAETLASLGAKRMIVGHTVQRNGINAACDGRVWRIDTGMAKAMGGKVEVLDVKGDVVTVRKEGG